MLPLYHDLHFTFRFAEDRIIPRFHLEGVCRSSGSTLAPGTGGACWRLRPWVRAGGWTCTSRSSWVDLHEPILVRAGEAFGAVPE
jgi:hypothetical protein